MIEEKSQTYSENKELCGSDRFKGNSIAQPLNAPRELVDEMGLPTVIKVMAPQLPIGGWVRRLYRYHPLPAELGMRLAPHPAQAAGLKFKVSDCTPLGRCSRVTFTQWVSNFSPGRALVSSLLRLATRPRQHPFRLGIRPIRRVMCSPCLSAAGLRFLAVLSHWSISITLRCAYCQRQTPLGFPRSA
jgi:hypothetical protein